MVRIGCPTRTSLGITRSFPRLYPVMGLVTVALLTLAPLALRPVRLACLIHAANVHSEPGSNPSKMSRSPAIPRFRGESSGSRSPPERVEEFCWSHRHSTIAIGPATSPVPLRTPVSCHPPPPNRVTCAGPCEPSRRPTPGGPTGQGVLTTLARRLPSRVLDATNTYLRLVVFG